MSRLPPAFLTRPLAHRGLHDTSGGVAENSASAFHAAIRAGYGIELDVQMSADHQPMVFHDYDMARLTGQPGPIQQRSADDLSRVTLTGGDDTVQTLPQILKLVSGRVPVLIEIKDQDGAMGPNVGPLETAVANALTRYRGPVAVMSFNPHSVAAFTRSAPEIPRGLVTDPFTAKDWPLLTETTRAHLAKIPDYTSLRASFISHLHSDLAAPRVAALRTAGAAVLCWTIKSRTAEATARKHAHNITFEGFLPSRPPLT